MIKKEVLFIKNDLFTLFLTIDFKFKENYWNIYNKEFDLDVDSTNDDLNLAKKEFVETIEIILQKMIKTNRWKKNFENYGLTLKPVEKIIEEKNQELLEFEENKKSQESIQFNWQPINNSIYI